MTDAFLGNRIDVRPWLCCLAVVLLAGCGNGRLPCIPAKCAIKVDGQPYGPATAIFHRSGDKPEDRRPTASIGADGSGEISTYELGDGIPEGDYKVTVVEGGIGGSKVARAYANQATSPLQAKVFKNSDVITLELEAPKNSTPSGLRIPGAKSSDEMLQESMPAAP